MMYRYQKCSTFRIVVTVIIILVLAHLTWTHLIAIRLPGGPAQVGVLVPLTGPAEEIGVVAKNVLTLAQEDRNQEGGVQGHLVEYVFADGQCSGEDARFAMEELVERGIAHVIGGFCSGETLGAAPIANHNEVILLSPTSSDSSITNAGKYVFRVAPSDAESGEQIAKQARDFGWRRVAIIGERHRTYAQGLIKAFSRTFQIHGGEIVLSETYDGDTPTDAHTRTVFKRIKEEQPDFIYLVSQTGEEHMADILLLGEEMGIDIPYIASEEAGNSNIVSLGNVSDGIIFAKPYLDETRTETKDLLDRYTERFGEQDTLPNFYITSIYDTAMIVFDAMEDAGHHTERARDYLNKLKNYTGASNPSLSFDEHGDANQTFVIYQIQDGAVARLNTEDL